MVSLIELGGGAEAPAPAEFLEVAMEGPQHEHERHDRVRQPAVLSQSCVGHGQGPADRDVRA